MCTCNIWWYRLLLANRTYLRPVVTDRVAWSVGLSVREVCHTSEPCKTAEPIEMLFALRTLVSPGNLVLDGVQIPLWKGAIFWGRGVPLWSIRTHTVISAKMAEPIEMPFGQWGRMGPRNHVLDGGAQVVREVAMATSFWLSTGYNFGCMIASDTLFDSMGGFSIRRKYSRHRVSKARCHGNQFWD